MAKFIRYAGCAMFVVFIVFTSLLISHDSLAYTAGDTIKISGKQYAIVSDPNEFIIGLSPGGKSKAIIFKLKGYIDEMKQIDKVAKRKSVDFVRLNENMGLACNKCGRGVPNFVQLKLMGVDATNVGSAEDWVNYECPRCGSETVIMFQR